ncbi:MAG: DUF2203 domain-containing protein [Gemmataceae bacterium]
MASDTSKKFFTLKEANATLPLVRAIINDITELAGDLRDRYQRIVKVHAEQGSLSDVYQEELQQVVENFERDQERLQDFERELEKLGVYLKDRHLGLVDFPCWLDDHEVYLCWRQGEADIGHWHEVEAGFAGRKKITTPNFPETDGP